MKRPIYKETEMSSVPELAQSAVDDLNAKAQALYAQKAPAVSDKKWAELAVQCLKDVAAAEQFVDKDDVGDSFLYRRQNGIYVFCKVRGNVDLQDDSFQGFGFYLDSPPHSLGDLIDSE